jgi:hypothetical protein
MISRTISLWVTTLLLGITQSLFVEESQDFPIGSEVENLVLRPSGSVLVVLNTFPGIYEVETTANATPRVVYTFQNAVGTSSIAASSLQPDVYFFISGNFSFQTFSPTPGSYAIHRLSFDEHDKLIAKELASLEAISQPNGMISVPGTPYVLIADTRAGFVYRFDTETLELTTYFDDPLLKPDTTTPPIFGVNGIKLSRGYLYFSNTVKQIVARVKASGKESPLVGTPEIVATPTAIDDFIVNDFNGDLYLAENGANALGFVCCDGANGTVPETLFDGPNSTALLSPTAAIWAKGAEGRTLLVSNAGGFIQQVTGVNFTGGAGIKIVHLDK